jgi:hypothetical protein
MLHEVKMRRLWKRIRQKKVKRMYVLISYRCALDAEYRVMAG